jgi:SAM-dependent methyltransferase
MNFRSLAEPLLSNDAFRSHARKQLKRFGFDTTDWVRVVMYRECFEFLSSRDLASADVLEISGGPQWKRAFKFGSYTATQFPEFDICSEALDQQFDIVIADQVFEHLPWPLRAGKNVFKMLRPGGYFIVATPFLVRVHNVPIDCNRWTEQGLSFLLQESGFSADLIKTASWGNRACLKANLRKWRRYGWFRSLKNEPNYPVMVWAIAQKPYNAKGHAATE